MTMKACNFLDLPPKYTDYRNSKAAILSAPFDSTSTWKKGADKGPAAILEASAYVEHYDIETDSSIYTRGIHTYPKPITGKTPEELIPAIAHVVSACIADDKLPVLLGGNHTVSIGGVQGIYEQTRGFSVLQLDAHADLREEYEGSRFNHACVMARIKEFVPIVQVGLRSMESTEKTAGDPRRMFFAHEIYQHNEWIKECISLLEETVYITIDLDVFDPGIMPATGTPEPGGLSWYQVLGLLKAVCREKRVIGFDVVELCPGENHGPIFLAAKLIYKCLSYILT
jgi:agmatinase